jgi:cytidine deaminase
MTTLAPTEFTSLIQAAIATAKHAYVPYSNYQVGAALRALDGSVYTGCNVENAAYPSCICAERTALVKAVSEGRRQFDVIAVVTRNGGSPCGTCRQMLFEFAPDLQVIIADLEGQVHAHHALHELLLLGFGPSKLG